MTCGWASHYAGKTQKEQHSHRSGWGTFWSVLYSNLEMSHRVPTHERCIQKLICFTCRNVLRHPLASISQDFLCLSPDFFCDCSVVVWTQHVFMQTTSFLMKKHTNTSNTQTVMKTDVSVITNNQQLVLNHIPLTQFDWWKQNEKKSKLVSMWDTDLYCWMQWSFFLIKAILYWDQILESF